MDMLEDKVLAISSELTPSALAGIPTREPAFGVAALWIARALEPQALTSGYAVVDQTSVLATHLAEIIRQHGYELLTRQETKRLLDRLSESHPKLVEELVPKILSLGEVQKVSQQLLREQVSIRDLSTILEALIDISAVNKNPILLVEAARQSLGRALVRPLLSDDGRLRVSLSITLSKKSLVAHSTRKPSHNEHGIAAVLHSPDPRWLTHAGQRSDRTGGAYSSLLHASSLSSAALARTFPSQSGCPSPS
jgi:flagellar biosynthesis component FlhA